MNSVIRTLSGLCVAATLCVAAGCAGPSGSYILDPASGARKIDPRQLTAERLVYRLTKRDVLLVQIQPLEPAGDATRIDRGNHLQIGLDVVNPTSSTYRLLPGDELTLDFGEDSDRLFEAKVGPDGFLTMPRIGKNVRVEGMTIAELNLASWKLYTDLYLSPKPSWAVRRSATENIAGRSGEYGVGSDGAVLIPTVGRFVVLGKTGDEAGALIGTQASARFHNTIAASVSLVAVNAREQIDTRLTPAGLAMFTNDARLPTRVSDEGTIFVPGIGQVTAAGRSVAELRDDLVGLAGRRFQNPVDVNVSVQEFANEALFIGGEVKQPGRFAFADRMSLLKLIAQAGWATEFADLENILLLRETKPDEYTVYRTNLQEVMDGKGPATQDFKLTPQDLVIVPPTSVAKADRFVSQYLRGILPFGTNLSYSINRGVDIVR